MSDYVYNFRFLPTEVINERLAAGRLLPKAADAYRQVLDERAKYVPTNLVGKVCVSSHSGAYYAWLDEGQEIPLLFKGQRKDEFIINDDLADEHGLEDGHRIVFQLRPDMLRVAMIVKSHSKSEVDRLRAEGLVRCKEALEMAMRMASKDDNNISRYRWERIARLLKESLERLN